MIAAPVRIDEVFDDREAVRALFAEHAPYLAAAAYLPDGSDETVPRAADAVFPWFRGTWALGGEPRVRGVETILHNARFIAAATEAFAATRVVPKTVVVNINAPMPAGVAHVDVPSFHGATREHLPLRLLLAMGASGLFEPWRIREAGAISWFYDGAGGNFDYWPEGRDRAMRSEQPPFGNVAIVADNHRMYHRIGAIGSSDATLPKMTAAAEIAFAGDRWTIVDRGNVVASYAAAEIRLSVLWKAEVFGAEDESPPAPLSPQTIVEILQRDLGQACAAEDPLTDAAWLAHVYQTYRG